ncbi:MAG: hypothetical protein EOP07_23060 [Proteobacteria bacterium]|nr:MAG: hypothetical protein EOP07_23060 [Pseudomonadota bacterium]
MTKKTFASISLSLLFLIQACSGSNFQSDKKEGAVPEAAEYSAGSEKSGSSDGAPIKNLSGDDGKINPTDELNLKNCESVWGNDAPARTEDNTRVIHSNISVGSLGVGISDLKKTDKPEYVVVYSSIAVGGAPEWKLLNPNGYYCIVSAINVGTSLTVHLDKAAHIADSKASLNVGSVVEENASVSAINVGSQIKIIRE